MKTQTDPKTHRATHTPGPWDVKRVPVWAPPHPLDGIPAFEFSPFGGPEWLAKAKANARLIAAAPDAHAVLAALADHIECGANDINFSALFGDDETTFRQAIKAYISKTTGIP